MAPKPSTMWRDLERLRRAVRGDNWQDADAALDKCERWFSMLNPNTPDLAAQMSGMQATLTAISEAKSLASAQKMARAAIREGK